MASSSTISTPQPPNDLPRLPVEMWAQIFDDLESPENFRSLISASSTALGYFQDDKSRILRPFVDNINDHIDTDIIPILLSSIRVRKLLFKTPGLTPSQIGDELSTFPNPLFRPDTPNPFQLWDQNTSAIIKLTKSFPKITKAVWYYTGIRENLPRRMWSFPLASHTEAPRSEVKKFLITFMYQTILLDLSTYRDGTLFNPRTSILDSVAWEAANPNLEDVTPNLWQSSSDQAGALVINDRGLMHVAVEIAQGLHRRGKTAEGGHSQLMPVGLTGLGARGRFGEPGSVKVCWGETLNQAQVANKDSIHFDPSPLYTSSSCLRGNTFEAILERRRVLRCRRSYPICRLGLMEAFVDSIQSCGMRGDVKDSQRENLLAIEDNSSRHMVKRITFLLRMSLFVT